MMAITHLVLGTSVASLAIGTADPVTLAIAAIATQIPDLDTTESIAGRICWPLAKWIEGRSVHRGVTHSAVATLAIAATLAGPAAVGAIPWPWVFAAALGHTSACLSDAATLTGVRYFWPSALWCVIPGNPRLRLRTGSPKELWILAIAMIALIVGINVATGGGIVATISEVVIRTPATVVRMAQDNPNKRILVKLTPKGGGAAIEGEFVGSIGAKDLVIKANGELAEFKQESIADVVGKVGQATGPEEEQEIEEIAASDWLAQLPEDAIVIEGTIELDDAEDLSLANLGKYDGVSGLGPGIAIRYSNRKALERRIGGGWITTGKVLVRP